MDECLGVDLGNVIIDHMGFGTTPEFFRSGDYNLIPAVPGAINALQVLNHNRFQDRVFVIYNATDVADQKILHWLKSHDFFSRTGISPGKVRRTEHGRNKSSVCKLCHVTHFIDDRLEVLVHLLGSVDYLFLLRPQSQEVAQHEDFLSQVVSHESWDQLLQTLLT